jgi:GntR family transcriptional regulator
VTMEDDWRADPSAPEPMFEQLADHLRGLIEAGNLGPRTKLEPQLEMADHYGVSRGTVARATEILTDEGLIRWVKGKGLYTAEADVIDAWTHGRKVRSGVKRLAQRPAEAREPGLGKEPRRRP